MNMKSFLMVLGSASILLVAACEVTDTTGSGGTGGTSDMGGMGGMGGMAAGGAGGGTGGAGGAMCDAPIDTVNNCYTCAEWTTFTPCPGGKLCATGQTKLDAYMACICDATKGNCATDCDGKCANPPVDDKDPAKCMACVVAASTGAGKCTVESGECSNN